MAKSGKLSDGRLMDWSKYSRELTLLKLGYLEDDESLVVGWPEVEAALRKALTTCRLIFPDFTDFEVAFPGTCVASGNWVALDVARLPHRDPKVRQRLNVELPPFIRVLEAFPFEGAWETLDFGQLDFRVYLPEEGWVPHREDHGDVPLLLVDCALGASLSPPKEPCGFEDLILRNLIRQAMIQDFVDDFQAQ